MTTNERIGLTLKTTGDRALRVLRNWFLTGVVVAAPIAITVWVVVSFVNFVDSNIKPRIPDAWNPETYLEFALPGLGIVVAVFLLTALGALTANLIGKSLLGVGESVVERVPFVRFIYRTTKQVFETFASGDTTSFKEAVLIQYPRPGVWAVAFLTNGAPGGEIGQKVPGCVACFVVTSPNPATGYLVYVKPEEITRLDMPVDQAAKLVLSCGILGADQLPAKA